MTGSKDKKPMSKEERLAEQLRINLRRRKAAARKMKSTHQTADADQGLKNKKSE